MDLITPTIMEENKFPRIYSKIDRMKDKHEVFNYLIELEINGDIDFYEGMQIVFGYFGKKCECK